MVTYRQIDETLAGGFLPGGKPLTEQGQQNEAEAQQAAQCRANGGTWDPVNKTCIFPQQDTPKGEKTETSGAYDPNKGGFTTNEGAFFQTQNPDFVPQQTDQTVEFLPNGNVVYQGKELTKEEYAVLQGKSGAVTSNVQEAAALTPQAQRIQQAQQLSSQIGQYGQLGISPTGLDFGEAATQGIVNSIPGIIRSLGTGALVGGVVGGGAAGTAAGTALAPITGGLSIPAGAIIGGAIGLLSGITGGMISNLKSQRTDTVNAQKRVLDEGKQNLNDWATLAAQDPANRKQYIAEFNRQLALIDQAYRQMKLDTSRDVAKFETALPDLAEFEAFYSAAGEREALIADMRNSLIMSSQNVDYRMLELLQREGKL